LDATIDEDVDAAWQQEVVRRLHEIQSRQGKEYLLGGDPAEGSHDAAWQVSRCDFILKRNKSIF